MYPEKSNEINIEHNNETNLNNPRDFEGRFPLSLPKEVLSNLPKRFI